MAVNFMDFPYTVTECFMYVTVNFMGFPYTVINCLICMTVNFMDFRYKILYVHDYNPVYFTSPVIECFICMTVIQVDFPCKTGTASIQIYISAYCRSRNSISIRIFIGNL